MRCGWVAVMLGMVVGLAASAGAVCVGDCDADGTTTIAELVTTINIALGTAALDACPAADADADGTVAIAEAISAVQVALNGCAAEPRCPIVRVASSSGVAALAGPGLAVAPNGDFDIVTGRTQIIDGAPPRASGSVVLQRYDSSGALQSQSELATRNRVIIAPRLAGLPNSSGVVAWAEADPRDFGSPISRLSVRRFGSRGGALGSVATLATAAARHELSLATVSADGSGNAALSWMDREVTAQGATAFRGALRRQRPNGLDPTRALGCFGDPVAVTLGNDLGAVCVAFDIDPMQVVLRAFQLDGSEAAPLLDFRTVGPYGSIAAAASSDRIVAAWLQPLETPLRDSRVLAQVVNLSGFTIAGPLEVGTVIDTQVPPAVALQANGNFAVAFGESPLRVQRFLADGTPLGEPVVVDNTRVDELALGADGDGNLVVAWRWRDVLALRIPSPTSGACR